MTNDKSKDEMMQLQFQTITPAIAAELLANHNPSNRRLDTRHSAFLAQEMARGTFRPDNGDSIRIDVDGDILDGQHRLAAIVKTGKSVDMLVARNVDRETFATIDTGKRRTVHDIVHIDLARGGINTPKGLTSAARLLYQYESRFESGLSGSGSRVDAIPVDAVREACKRHGFVEQVERSAKIAHKMVVVKIAPVAVALVVCEIDNKDASDVFFHRLQTLEGLSTGSPEYSVDRALRSWRESGSTVQRSAYGQLFALLRGYIASRDGETLNFIRLPKTSDTFPYMPTIMPTESAR